MSDTRGHILVSAPPYEIAHMYAHVGGIPLGLAFDADENLAVCIPYKVVLTANITSFPAYSANIQSYSQQIKKLRRNSCIPPAQIVLRFCHCSQKTSNQLLSVSPGCGLFAIFDQRVMYPLFPCVKFTHAHSTKLRQFQLDFWIVLLFA